jgi:hypothetical protein
MLQMEPTIFGKLKRLKSFSPMEKHLSHIGKSIILQHGILNHVENSLYDEGFKSVKWVQFSTKGWVIAPHQESGNTLLR